MRILKEFALGYKMQLIEIPSIRQMIDETDDIDWVDSIVTDILSILQHKYYRKEVELDTLCELRKRIVESFISKVYTIENIYPCINISISTSRNEVMDMIYKDLILDGVKELNLKDVLINVFFVYGDK